MTKALALVAAMTKALALVGSMAFGGIVAQILRDNRGSCERQHDSEDERLARHLGSDQRRAGAGRTFVRIACPYAHSDALQLNRTWPRRSSGSQIAELCWRLWRDATKRIIFIQVDHFRTCAVSIRNTFRRLVAGSDAPLPMKSLCIQRPPKERLKRRALARNLQNNEILRQVASNWNVRRLLVDA
ncbi:hypothetical protein [Methylocystis rosea]|uniref:Uncharacterized protein n=1 Tax=Methylocystis rosea TaxID=173366 RepID=A0A3G8M3G3_9HYPH|nr:hypothetical protein [Methylocystis rosea]AZG76184.1 hypothetical protein EHO51_05240 [Methylocystis rosea]